MRSVKDIYKIILKFDANTDPKLRHVDKPFKDLLMILLDKDHESRYKKIVPSNLMQLE